jgi:cytidylate kinase
VITVDGPAASGKSALGIALAQALGYQFLDTGAIYRGFTWLALRERVDVEDEAALAFLARRCPPRLQAKGSELQVYFDGVDVTPYLRDAQVEANVSRVSRHPLLRAALREIQRALVERGRIVMAGRDIGSAIAPDAGVKIYLDASPETRRRRRGLQAQTAGDDTPASAQESVAERDRIDSTRAASPLAVPEGAFVIHTDDLTLEQVREAALRCIQSAA